MSAIGNFDIARPPAAVLAAYARLFAWKLSLYNIRADNPRIHVKGRYLHAINGHRDVGQTACPGRYLYAKIPYIRTAGPAHPEQPRSRGPARQPPPSPHRRPGPTLAFTSPTQTPRTPWPSRRHDRLPEGDEPRGQQSTPTSRSCAPTGSVVIRRPAARPASAAPCATGGLVDGPGRRGR